MLQNSEKRHPRGPQIAVVIPAYNNAASIRKVVEGARKYCGEIIVVDDGSSDNTREVLGSIDGLRLISFPENRGKGCALQAGLRMAAQMGMSHVVTMDGDGQHVADDIAVFLDKVHAEPETLWVGNRAINASGAEAPLRSRFGRRFGNFWYRFNTSVILHDTQCGFRAYPLDTVLELRARGTRYEYEQDVLIRAAWNGVEVREVDVHQNYLPPGSRISHFRPVRDFLRISLVNARAGFLRVAFPVATYHAPGHGLREKILSIVKYELRAHTTPRRAAFSLALGVFMGIFPIHGFQVVTLMGLAALLGLNRPLAFLGVCVSSPPFLPFLIIAAVAIGRVVLPPGLIAHADSAAAQKALQGGVEFVVGSAVLAVLGGLVTFGAVYPILVRLKKSGLLRRKARKL